MSTSSKEQFYNNLNAATYCGWDWCGKLYGYQCTDVGFLERVYARLVRPPEGKIYLCALCKDADSPRNGADAGGRQVAGRTDK